MNNRRIMILSCLFMDTHLFLYDGVSSNITNKQKLRRYLFYKKRAAFNHDIRQSAQLRKLKHGLYKKFLHVFFFKSNFLTISILSKVPSDCSSKLCFVFNFFGHTVQNWKLMKKKDISWNHLRFVL